MEIKELKDGKAVFGNHGISIEERVQAHGRDEFCLENLVFVHNIWPMQIVCEGHSQFVPERSITKVHPNTRVFLESEKDSIFYFVTFHADESAYLAELCKNPFLLTLKGEAKEEWEEVKDKNIDFVDPDERNSEHIITTNRGILIAPPHSRFESGVSYGWNVRYSRGSRVLGISSDILFSVRKEDEYHVHSLMSEFYFCISGSMILTVNGEDYFLTPKKVLLASPGEPHAVTSIVDPPYRGITMKLPSIPGDKTVLNVGKDKCIL